MDNDTVFPSFVVTHEAIDKIVDLGGAVRVWLDGWGCCELSYEFADSKGVEGDAAFGCPGAELFVSQPALEVLTGGNARLHGSPHATPLPGAAKPQHRAAMPMQPVLRRRVARPPIGLFVSPADALGPVNDVVGGLGGRPRHRPAQLGRAGPHDGPMAASDQAVRTLPSSLITR